MYADHHGANEGRADLDDGAWLLGIDWDGEGEGGEREEG